MKTTASKVTADSTANIERDKLAVQVLKTGTEKEKQAAFAQLYKRYHDHVRFFMLTRVKSNAEIADDLTQEVFMKVHTKISQYDGTHAFSTWLFKMASNHLIDFKRQTKSEVLSIESLKADYGGDDESTAEAFFQIVDNSRSANIEKIIEHNERVALTQDAIASIKNVKQKRVVELFFMEQLSHEETAKEMNECVNTVKGLILRAKVAMKDYFEVNQIEMA